jgi:hypothetical protein
MSWQQAERQKKRSRSTGRYTQLNPCEVCGKSAGADYFSARGVDDVLGGRGLVLCGDCCGLVDDLRTVEAKLALLRGKR